MIKRLFWLIFGLGAGIILGGFVVKRVDDASQAVSRAMTPSRLAEQAGAAAGAFLTRFRRALEEGRVAAEAREAELRERHDVPGVRESLRRAG